MKYKRIKKCQYCKKEFEPWPPTAKVCSIDCAANIARKKREKLERAETREKLVAFRKISWHHERTKRACHEYIRTRDEGKLCITCDTVLVRRGRVGGDYDAGHFRTVGAAGHLRYDEANIHGQCKDCNHYGSGMATEYQRRLPERIGESELQRLLNDNRVHKWTKEELGHIYDYFRRKTKELRERRAYEMNDLHLAEVANDNT